MTPMSHEDTVFMRMKRRFDFKGLLILVLAAGLAVQGLAWTKKEEFGWDEFSDATLWFVLLVVAFNLYLSDSRRKAAAPPPAPGSDATSNPPGR
jgi:hypothetical protein